MKIKNVWILLLISFAGCAQYADQRAANLEDYKAGRITAAEYRAQEGFYDQLQSQNRIAAARSLQGNGGGDSFAGYNAYKQDQRDTLSQRKAEADRLQQQQSLDEINRKLNEQKLRDMQRQTY